MTFNEFVLSLFNTPSGDFNTDFKQKIKTITDEDVQNFWKALIDFMESRADELDSEHIDPTTVLQSDFDVDSFFNYIQTKSDKDIELNNLGDYWNESIKTLVAYFNEHFNDEAVEETITYSDGAEVINGKIPVNENYAFNSRDIKNSDAGLAFGAINDIVITVLVRPWYNSDMWSYYKARGYSIDRKAASNDKNLHFTRVQEVQEYENNLNRWIRLLMPNNSRRVAVEDLNRNFWVISSVLQGLSAYLLGDNAPIPYLLKNFLNEITQLWNNVLYLWMAFGLISQKESSDIRVVIMPLPDNEYQPYQRYEGFVRTDFPVSAAAQSEYVISRVKYLAKKYTHSNLCILPYTRQNNYYRNHFGSQTFRGVVFYNKKKDKFTYVPFRAVMGETTDASVYFNPKNYDRYLYAIRETDTYYRWSFPIKNIGNVLDENDFRSKRFYGSIRIIPQIDLKVNSVGDLEISNLTLTAIDAVAKSLFNTNSEILRYTTTAPITESSEEGIFNGEVLVDGEPALGNLQIYDGTVQQALYLGEIPSCSGLSASHPIYVYDDGKQIIGEGKLIKIGNYLPKAFVEYMDNTEYYGQQKVPDGSRSTDYLLNLTITGSQHKSVVKQIYGGHLGSDYVVDDSKSYYFTPVVNSRGSYSLTHNSETPDMLFESDYRERGAAVISEYIAKDTTPDSITYFIAGVGIKPWHNTEPNDLFQGYWTSTVLTHMYRYIPLNLEIYIPASELEDATIVYQNGQKIGSLQCLGKINKLEQAFSIDGGQPTDTFELHGGTTWRLPQLIPQKDVASYLIFTEQLSQLTYFIDPADPHFAPFYNNGGVQAITNELNTNYIDYTSGGQYEDKLMTTDNIQLQLSNPSGTWCVFDGNSNINQASNRDKYRKQTDRREVAYTDFNFNNSQLEFKVPHKGRKKSNSAFTSINPSSNLLPYSGSANMNFSW